jgi:hypothetical protein
MTGPYFSGDAAASIAGSATTASPGVKAYLAVTGSHDSDAAESGKEQLLDSTTASRSKRLKRDTASNAMEARLA